MALKSHLLGSRIGSVVKSIIVLLEDPGLIPASTWVLSLLILGSDTLCDAYKYINAGQSMYMFLKQKIKNPKT